MNNWSKFPERPKTPEEAMNEDGRMAPERLALLRLLPSDSWLGLDLELFNALIAERAEVRRLQAMSSGGRNDHTK